MFIKWQSRTNPKRWNVSARYCAYLVKNYREGKKVRQKVVSYLGSITGYKKQNKRGKVVGEEFYPFRKRDFYQQVQKNLGKLNISEKEKDKVLKSLSLKVRHPSSKEMRQAKAEFKAWEEGLKVLSGLRRR